MSEEGVVLLGLRREEGVVLLGLRKEWWCYV